MCSSLLQLTLGSRNLSQADKRICMCYVQLNLHETDLLFQYLSHHLTWHCLLIYGFPPVFTSSCVLRS